MRMKRTSQSQPAAQASSPARWYCAIFSSAATKLGRWDLQAGRTVRVGQVDVCQDGHQDRACTMYTFSACTLRCRQSHRPGEQHLSLASAAARSSFHSGANKRQRSATLATPAVARWTCTNGHPGSNRCAVLRARTLDTFFSCWRLSTFPNVAVGSTLPWRTALLDTTLCTPQHPVAHLMLRLQHVLDDCRALADVCEEGERQGLGFLAVHIPGDSKPAGDPSEMDRQTDTMISLPTSFHACCLRVISTTLPCAAQTHAHWSGASRQVPSVQRRKGLADSTRLRSRRPSCLEASAVEGETTTSDASSARDSCGGGAGQFGGQRTGVGQQGEVTPA